MNLKIRASFIFLMLLVHQTHTVVLLNEDNGLDKIKKEEGNNESTERKLVSKKKSKKVKKNQKKGKKQAKKNKKQKKNKKVIKKKTKLNKNKKKAKKQKSKTKRKLYFEDYQTKIKSFDDYTRPTVYGSVTKYLSLALTTMLLLRNLARSPLKSMKSRKAKQIVKKTETLFSKIKGKKVDEFLKSENSKFGKFLKKRNRKLQGEDLTSSIVDIGTSFISQEFGIPPAFVKSLVPVTKKILESFQSSKKEGIKPKKKAKKLVKTEKDESKKI